MPRRRSSFARCPRHAPAEHGAARGARRARLPGGDHVRVRGSGAAGAAVPAAAGARAVESDRERSCRSCACRCGRACCARRSRTSAASRTASACSSTARALQSSGGSDARDRLARRRCLRRAAAGAVGHREGRARRAGLLRRQGRCRRHCSPRPGDAAVLQLRGRGARRRCTRGAARACCAAVSRSAGSANCIPTLLKSLDFTYAPVLFELDVAAPRGAAAVRYQEISRFPQVRRDLAVVVDEAVTLSTLAERVTLAASSLLRELRVFDVYRGPGLEEGRKSVALGLIFQDISRTLTDDDVERLMASVVADLRENLNARIRE